MQMWWNGRHAGLRGSCLTACEFKSHHLHHVKIFTYIQNKQYISHYVVLSTLERLLDNIFKLFEASNVLLASIPLTFAFCAKTAKPLPASTVAFKDNIFV